MPHIPHDDLAWRAASRVEGVGPIDEHLRTCVQCSDELAALQRTVASLRVDAVEPEVLPDDLWSRIAAEVAEPDVEAAREGERPDAADERAARPAPPAAAPSPVRSPRRPRRRRFSTRTLVAACVATALVVVGGVAIGAWLAQRPADDAVLADIPLEPLTGGLDAATARIVERDGHRLLVIETEALPPADGGYLDVWLIDEDVVGMVNVGILDGTSGEYVLPDDLDLGRYPIVDVSVEPLDGDPTHSGDSVWRGTLA